MDKNKEAYSYRIHELFFRVCIEVEANCKAILRENGYSKNSKDLNMNDYCLIEKTHKLSEFEILLPRWEGEYGRYHPFRNWVLNKKLNWYFYYNIVKHDISINFRHANIKNLVEATSGLVALLSSQFLNEDFSPNDSYLTTEGIGDGMESSIGGLFRVKYPKWNDEERYSFDWNSIKDDHDLFQSHDYNELQKNVQRKIGSNSV